MPDLYPPAHTSTLAHPEWTRSATLYQINTRQFTPEGTFRAAQAHLPRLQTLGVDILWLMPVHPIGEVERKGSLGSPYAVRDYKAVNPEFGTLEDLRAFVDEAHALGMRVILDWVANHTAPDHPWVHEHPEWYARDARGALRPTPWWDWTDIVDLDYRQPGLWRAMTDAMAFWLREADIDGFRCDVAGFVPTPFWERARAELDAIKPVFMLAEWQARDLHARAFDATYAWDWYDAMHAVASGAQDVSALFKVYAENQGSYPPEAQRMTFVSNHDKNAWDGTMWEQFGDALNAAIVLSVVGEGMPLLYNGQEAGNDRRLAFFDRDPILWREHPVGDLYRRLFALKHDAPALHNAPWGGRMVRVPNNDEAHVLSFVREAEGSVVFAAFNFSPEARAVAFRDALHHRTYRVAPLAAGEQLGVTKTFGAETHLAMAPWSARVFLR